MKIRDAFRYVAKRITRALWSDEVEAYWRFAHDQAKAKLEGALTSDMVAKHIEHAIADGIARAKNMDSGLDAPVTFDIPPPDYRLQPNARRVVPRANDYATGEGNSRKANGR